MTRVGRITAWTVGGFLLVLVGGVLLMMNALDRKIAPACLDKVAQAPSGEFYTIEGTGRDGERVIRYEDGLALPVRLDAKRIVSGLPGITEMLCHLGAEKRLIAVSAYCDWPASVRTKKKVSVQPFDAEAVVALKPDLLVLDRRLHRRDLAVIQRRVKHILLLDTSRSLPHLAASMRLLAEIVGGPGAKQTAVEFQNHASGLVTRIGLDLPETPTRVLVVGQWDPLYVLGRGSLIDDLLRICGCVNVACDLRSDASGTFSEELVLARKPDVILTPREAMPGRIRERWRSVPAVKQKRLIDGSGDELVRAGPRILGALDRLAAHLRAARE